MTYTRPCDITLLRTHAYFGGFLIMIKTFVRAAAMVIILALVASCSQKGFNTNLTIEPKPVPGVDWTQYKSWSFGRQGEYVQTGIAEVDDPAFRKSVGENTVKLMNDRGYEHVNE